LPADAGNASASCSSEAAGALGPANDSSTLFWSRRLSNSRARQVVRPYCAEPLILGRHVRGDVHRPQLVHEVLGVIVLFGTEGGPDRPIGARLDHISPSTRSAPAPGPNVRSQRSRRQPRRLAHYRSDRVRQEQHPNAEVTSRSVKSITCLSIRAASVTPTSAEISRRTIASHRSIDRAASADAWRDGVPRACGHAPGGPEH